MNTEQDIAYLSATKFKDRRLLDEFNDSNPHLQALVLYLGRYAYRQFDTVLIVTHVHRTQKEQDEIYKDNFAYQKGPWKSVHQFGRGTDIRIRNLPRGVAVMLCKHINTNWHYGSFGKPTALLERNHIHLQVPHNAAKGGHRG